MLRLVGLYHGKRGGHTAFTRMQQVPRFGGSGVNLLHYEDAAMLTGEVSLSVLELGWRNRGSHLWFGMKSQGQRIVGPDIEQL